MDQRLRPIAHTFGDLFYSQMVRRIVGGVVVLWVLMMVLGIEVLTGTEQAPFVDNGLYAPMSGGEWTCTYWTGLGFRTQESPIQPQCDVWRWGRQFSE